MRLIKNKENSDLFKIFLSSLVLLLFFLSLSSNYALNPSQDIGGTEGLGNLPNGGTLTLDSGIYNKSGDKNLLLNDKNVTIRALKPNNVTIDLLNSGNFINISSTAKLTLINITIINGDNIIDGGAINNKGTLILDGCTFINNNAVYGGAVSNEGNLTVTNCKFIENTADNGAAINVGGLNGILDIFNSTFINNIVSNGAIIFNNPHTTVVNNLDIKSSVFYNNTANHLIYTTNMPDLADNFYFWVLDDNNPYHRDINNMIPYAVNNLSYIGSYYYIELRYDPNVVSGNKLYLDYYMKHSANQGIVGLTVTDISLKNGATDIQGFNYLVSGTWELDVAGDNLINLNYFTSPFYNIIYGAGKIDTSLSLNSSNLIATINSTLELNATLLNEYNDPIVGVNVSFYLNNGTLLGNNTTDSNGFARLFYKFNEGLDTSYYAFYNGNTTYKNSTSSSASVIIDKSSSNLVLSPIESTVYGEVVQIIATLTNGSGNPIAGKNISFIIDGVEYSNITNASGIAILNHAINLSKGSYPVTAKFTGDNLYDNSSSNMETLTVNSSIAILTLQGEGNQKVGDTYTLIATLIGDGPIVGEEIIFYLNGVEIGRNKTNSEGVAYWHHTFTNNGEHSFSAKFVGDANYGESTIALALFIVDDIESNENDSVEESKDYAYASMEKTGIPIIAIILVLLSSLGLIAKRKE